MRIRWLWHLWLRFGLAEQWVWVSNPGLATSIADTGYLLPSHDMAERDVKSQNTPRREVENKSANQRLGPPYLMTDWPEKKIQAWWIHVSTGVLPMQKSKKNVAANEKFGRHICWWISPPPEKRMLNICALSNCCQNMWRCFFKIKSTIWKVIDGCYNNSSMESTAFVHLNNYQQ